MGQTASASPRGRAAEPPYRQSIRRSPVPTFGTQRPHTGRRSRARAVDLIDRSRQARLTRALDAHRPTWGDERTAFCAEIGLPRNAGFWCASWRWIGRSRIMEVSIVPAWTDLSSFKAPLRVLAQHFLASRERWKAKYMALKEDANRLRTQTRDLGRSRDLWKQKAKTLAQELAQERRAHRRERAAIQSSPPSANEPPPAPNSRFAPPLVQSSRTAPPLVQS